MADAFQSVATSGIHGDDALAVLPDVAAPIRVSTTFSYTDDPDKLIPLLDDENPELVYSRCDNGTTQRVEAVLSKILDAPCVAYASGLAAFYAALVCLNPKTIFIGESYHGCLAVVDLMKRNYNTKVYGLDADPSLLGEGDLIHLETPVNPQGTARDITKYAAIAKSRKAFLMVDATFAPSPLSDPLKLGANIVMHSGTKYFGGHSDLLSGVLATRDLELKKRLHSERMILGSIPSSHDSWLLLRSLRTYQMRLRTQTDNANKLVKYLIDHQKEFPVLRTIHHASLQTESWVREQLPLGGPPVFSIELSSEKAARTLPSKLRLFHHATSLGGIESLVEWRLMSDPHVAPELLRFSVGGENYEDLINDITRGLHQV